MLDPHRVQTRRGFLWDSSSCAAHLMAAAALGPSVIDRLFTQRPVGRVIRTEPWGRIEEVAEGVWAMISTPLVERDFTTIANGGIIAGRDAVLAVEGLGTVEGARWLGDAAQELTGRRPTHVVLTHHHGDHSSGQAGYAEREGELRVIATEETHARLLRSAQTRLMPNVVITAGSGPTELDLGGRIVRFIPRSGHTCSDLVIEIYDPRVTWCGDLVWNAMFPNYVDARPSELIESVRATLTDGETLYVPGHGDMAGRDDLRSYVSLLEDVEDAARRSFARGVSAEEAAREYVVPAALGEWVRFNERYYEVAIGSWHRELDVGAVPGERS